MRSLALAMSLSACGAQLSSDDTPAPSDPSGPADDPNSGGAGGGGGGGGGTGLTPAAYITAIATTQCGQLFECRPQFPGVPEDFSTYYGDLPTDCVARAIDGLSPNTLEAEVAKQRIVFDGAAAASCIAGFGQPDCATFWTHDWLWVEACYHVFNGTVPDGGACAIDYDCANAGSACDPASLRCAPLPQ